MKIKGIVCYIILFLLIVGSISFIYGAYYIDLSKILGGIACILIANILSNSLDY